MGHGCRTKSRRRREFTDRYLILKIVESELLCIECYAWVPVPFAQREPWNDALY